MSKTKTTDKKPQQVPAAELVGEHAKNKEAIDNASDVSNVMENTENDTVLAEGALILLGIDLGLGKPSIAAEAIVKNGLPTLDATAFKLAELMLLVGEADDDDKIEILKALQSYLGITDANLVAEDERKDPTSIVREKYRADYPALTRAMEDWKASGNNGAPDIRITSKIEGFWRAGMQHSTTPVEMSSVKFNPEELELLLTEPNLTIELI